MTAPRAMGPGFCDQVAPSNTSKHCARPSGHPGQHRSSLADDWDTAKWWDDEPQGVLPETPEPPKACECCATNDDPGFKHGGQCGQCGHSPRLHDSFRAQLAEPAVHRLKIERPIFGAVVYSGVCSCNRWSADLYDPADISSCWVVNHLRALAPTDVVPAPQSSPTPLLPLSAPVETEGQVEGVRGQLADHLVPIALAAGWTPPPCNCLPFDVCDTCWGPEQQRESQIRQLAYCEEIIPCGPEDADQCPNLREPGSVHCAQHQPSPLPADEVEPDALQWGYREHPAEDVDPVREEYARFRAADDHLTLVQREVRYGPWVAVPVEPKETNQ